MSTKVKNLLFVLAGLSLILVYILFFKKDNTNDANLTVNTTNINTADIAKVENNPIDEQLSSEILATLSSIKSITLEDKIFNSKSFQSLVDGTVSLVKDGNEGRPNPFAPIGADASLAPTNATPVESAATPTPTTTPTTTAKPETASPSKNPN
jgi:hypothetical protein